MIPVMQTIFSAPGGDCFQACVASIFELPLSDVPHFLGDSPAHDHKWSDAQWERVLDFAAARDHQVVQFPSQNNEERVKELEASDYFYIATGRAGPGCNWSHSVVMRKGQFVHDPAPSRAFIHLDPEHLYFIFFVPRASEISEANP